MMRATLGMAAVALGVAAAPAVAQDPEGERPARSIAVSVQGSPTVGLWMRGSENMDFGLTVGARLGSGSDDDDDVETTIRQVSVEPAVKLFSTAVGAFRPYTYVGLEARFGKTRTESGPASFEARETGVGANLGVGADWHPTRRVSVGGHVGLGAGWSTAKQESGTTTDEADGWDVRTFNSGIRVHLFL